MSEVATGRNYSAFDAELTHQALNMRLFMRLLRWAKPYRITLNTSSALVVVGAAVSVLMPVIQGPVVVDTILIPNDAATTRFNFGLIAATEWLSGFFSMPPLGGAVVLFVGLTIVHLFLMVGHQLTLASGALKTLRDLRLDLFASLEHKPASFYDHVAVGRVMTRVTNDVENLFRLLTGFVSLAGQFVPFFFAAFMMLLYSRELTGVVMLVIPAAAVATFIFRVVMRKIFRLVRDSMSALNQYMQEDLMGIEVVQLSGREEMNAEEYGALNRENRKQEYRAIDYEVVFETFNTSLTSIAIAGIVWYGGGEVVQSEITLGALLMFNSFIGMMVAPVSTVGNFFNTLFRAMASGERIFQAIDWDERLHEPEHPVQLPERFEGSVEFRHASFAYPASDPVLRDVSFAISPGEKLAVVGPTGAGKSTIIRLLARFYDFEDGMIFVDGIDVNRIASGDLRKRVGVVLQDFHIFSGTVLENISLNDPNISRERAQWAARVVNADSFIRDLQDGYETELAERGHNLSQGQQQLLAFARVLAKDPEILVLDEATSSIDTGTELIIQDALHKLAHGRTSIIIAHRLQTIRECDRILVLDQGTVKELGTHEELIAKRGIYFTLHELQFQDSLGAAELARAKRKEDDRQNPRWADMSDEDDDVFPSGGMGSGAQSI